jgi:hypothetical protein
LYGISTASFDWPTTKTAYRSHHTAAPASLSLHAPCATSRYEVAGAKACFPARVLEDAELSGKDVSQMYNNMNDISLPALTWNGFFRLRRSTFGVPGADGH